jgi:glucose/arabinose dehydrogenase
MKPASRLAPRRDAAPLIATPLLLVALPMMLPLLLASPAPASAAEPARQADPFGDLYAEHCSVCHGAALEGAAQGTPLAGVELRHGNSMAALTKSIAEGVPGSTMPAFGKTLDAVQVKRLATYVAEANAYLGYADFRIATPPALPTGTVHTDRHDFRVEVVAQGIDRLPYSLAPLPDGSFLVTEKTRGLRQVSRDGKVSPLIRGTPPVFDDGFEVPGIRLVYGLGYLLDVLPHPDYERNGWIYLHFTERCAACNKVSRESGRPVSMNKVIRGRIRNGEWVDQQTIWSTDIELYNPMPDMAAGGRLAFDGQGHLFFSVGIKGGSETAGIQDLSLPFGKIHRIRDDGSIPADNPFVGRAGVLGSIWSYGHRTPEGLEFNRTTGHLWETEMGQRGGDEVNLLRPGRNYGWPLISKGLGYDGQPVNHGPALGIQFRPGDIEQPALDLTPTPAVSSFVIYDGAAFPRWQQSLLVGSLKGMTLYRMETDGSRITHVEELVSGMGRIRDVAQGAAGEVFLLLENAAGSRIVRLVPVTTRTR